MNFLSGYKTKIGMAIILIAQFGRAFAPDVVPWELIEQAGMWIGGIGIAAPAVGKLVEKAKASE